MVLYMCNSGVKNHTSALRKKARMKCSKENQMEVLIP